LSPRADRSSSNEPKSRLRRDGTPRSSTCLRGRQADALRSLFASQSSGAIHISRKSLDASVLVPNYQSRWLSAASHTGASGRFAMPQRSRRGVSSWCAYCLFGVARLSATYFGWFLPGGRRKLEKHRAPESRSNTCWPATCRCQSPTRKPIQPAYAASTGELEQIVRR
jgi:hypothetical protein